MEEFPVSDIVAPMRIGCSAWAVEGPHKPMPMQKPTEHIRLMQTIARPFLQLPNDLLTEAPVAMRRRLLRAYFLIDCLSRSESGEDHAELSASVSKAKSMPRPAGAMPKRRRGQRLSATTAWIGRRCRCGCQAPRNRARAKTQATIHSS